MSKKDEKILEQSYSIEALENELESLEDEISDQKERIWQLIQENDRLTLTYEPYRPPGDENENTGYYDLIESIKESDEEIRRLRAMVREYQSEAFELNRLLKAKNKKRHFAGCVSFDFWPLSDWFRLSHHKWNPGKAFQICVGPIRLDVFED